MRSNLKRSVALFKISNSETFPLLGKISGQQNSFKFDSTSCRRPFHSVQDNRHSWSVLKHLYDKQIKSANKKYACFMLNLTDKNFKWFERHKYIWDEADLKVAVDGSANALARRGLLHTADLISGDFDSIDANLITRLQSPRKAIKTPKNTDNSADTSLRMPLVVETPCQRETDFTKAIHAAMSLKPQIQHFFGLYFIDGYRLDHLFGLVNTLHLIKKNIFIMNTKSNTISWLLQPGNHTIHKRPGQELCCLLPFTGPTEIKTQGLQYNLSPAHPSKFGGLISTSNLCLEQRDTVVIDTNRELLWSIDMFDLQNNKADD